MNTNSLLKIELHLHLDCSLSYGVVLRLAPEVTREQYLHDYVAPAKCTNLADFLTRAPMGYRLMQSAEQLRLVTEDLFRQLVQDNVIYAEIRFAPLLHLEQGLAPEQVVASVDAAVAKSIQATGIEARIILCTLRHFTAEQSLRTAALVEQFRGSHVVALDIAGDEAGCPVDAHIPAFEYAFAKGISITCHAGEASGPPSVWETLKHFKPSRIGHGIRSIEDHDLIEHIKRHGIHLEVCPSSNIQTDAYDQYDDHPIDRLFEYGVSVGINTDARTLVNITLTEEYRRLNGTFGWGREQFLRCNLDALEAAFIPDDIKAKLRTRLVESYQAQLGF